jgi:hypothetical protein
MSSENGDLERRVAAVEQAVAELRKQLAAVTPVNWLDRVKGSITDEEAFLEALEYGRAIREADRPADEADEKP